MKINFKEHKVLIIGFCAVAVLFVITWSYSYFRMNSLSAKIDSLSTNVNTLASNFASSTEALKANISETHSSLSTALNNEQKRVGDITDKLGNFEDKVGSISGKVNTLQKLAKTDGELLKKYSKVYFLNDNYIPARLAEIPNEYSYSNIKKSLIHTDVLPFVEDMFNSASSSGIKLYVSSAYRSFTEQRIMKATYRVTYGAGTANSFSADQGYSEHQLGTAMDITTTGLGGGIDGFENTLAYKWMLDNAYKYGFILSYPKNNNYYIYEPWHWRFIGVKLATYLHKEDLSFYDLDQRTIDKYLVNIFD